MPFSTSGTIQADTDNPLKAKVGRFKHQCQEVAIRQDREIPLQAWVWELFELEIEKVKAEAVRIPATAHMVNNYGRLSGIMQDMQDIGFFYDAQDHKMSNSTMFQPDLHAGNIFVDQDPTSATNKLRLSGIIDWDRTEARPRLLARVPPYFLWTPESLT